jgi:hypothetical protein
MVVGGYDAHIQWCVEEGETCDMEEEIEARNKCPQLLLITYLSM